VAAMSLRAAVWAAIFGYSSRRSAAASQAGKDTPKKSAC